MRLHATETGAYCWRVLLAYLSDWCTAQDSPGGVMIPELATMPSFDAYSSRKKKHKKVVPTCEQSEKSAKGRAEGEQRASRGLVLAQIHSEGGCTATLRMLRVSVRRESRLDVRTVCV